MKGRWIRLVLGLVMAAGSAAACARMQLDTSIAPPYQTEQDGVLGGSAVTTLNCVFGKIGLSYQVRVVPWRRAWFNLQNNLTDGVFSVMAHPEMEAHGRLSAPLALEKWYWFGRSLEQLRAPDFPANLRLGAVLGSNASGWMRQRGLIPVEEVTSERQLLQLLDSGRIDAFLADAATMEQWLTEQQSRAALYSDFEKYTPLAVYFSHAFLASRPGFFERFNAELAECNTASMALSDGEHLRLVRLMEAMLLPLSRSSEVLAALRRQRDQGEWLSQMQIDALDEQWRREISATERPLIQTMLQQHLSRYLQVFEEKHPDFTEVMVVDRQGMNLGISRPSSDYWQGDEDKFLQVFPPARDSYHVGSIEYDASTGKFQVPVSVRVTDPDSGEALGVLIVGVDIEAILQD